MAERKGAAYKIKATRPAHHHGDHTQTTQATSWAQSVGSTSGSAWSAAMGARTEEYGRARAGQMSEEEARRVGINLNRL